MLLASFNPKEEFITMTEELRSYVNARDDGLCLMCGNSANDGPHHIKYRSLGGKHCANNLASICTKCHFKVHNVSDEVSDLLLKRIKENEKKFRENLV